MRSKLVVLGALAITVTAAPFAVGTNMMWGAASEELAGAPSVTFTGKVIETMNASRYTYVQIDTGKKKIWAAGPVTAVKVGDNVSISAGEPNKNFSSPTLKRKFDELYFVGAILPAGSAGAAGDSRLPPGHPSITPAGDQPSAGAAIEAIQKPAGGKTVGEIWDQKASLSGKPVVLRAKAVKVVANVMGKNFLHLRDGTGREGSNDLVATTKDVVTVGAVVTASGIVSTDKDYGSGYKYAVMIEDAAISK